MSGGRGGESLTDATYLPVGEEVRFGFPPGQRGAEGLEAPGSDDPVVVTLERVPCAGPLRIVKSRSSSASGSNDEGRLAVPK